MEVSTCECVFNSASRAAVASALPGDEPGGWRAQHLRAGSSESLELTGDRDLPGLGLRLCFPGDSQSNASSAKWRRRQAWADTLGGAERDKELSDFSYFL